MDGTKVADSLFDAACSLSFMHLGQLWSDLFRLFFHS
jgi:hypothetical protein